MVNKTHPLIEVCYLYLILAFTEIIALIGFSYTFEIGYLNYILWYNIVFTIAIIIASFT